MNPDPSMTHSVFDALRRLAYDEAGIAIRENKQTLVSARIAKRMRECGISTEREYLAFLEGDKSGQEMVRFLDAISTNFTSFFREPDHFQLFEEEIRRLVEKGSKTLRIWCAAAATGEEPYSLAITLAEAVHGTGADWRLLASDISEASSLQSAQVPPGLRARYFAEQSASAGEEAQSRVANDLRGRVLFKRVNLATPPFPMRGDLDVVFCRNVMIYFDNAVRQRLVGEIERLLRPGGLLVVAHSETLNGIRSGLRTVQPSVYRKVGS